MDVYHLEDYQATSPAGFTKRVFLQSPNGLVFRLNFEPGQSLPAHTHAESEIAVAVLEGEGTATVEGGSREGAQPKSERSAGGAATAAVQEAVQRRVEVLRPGTVVHCRGDESFSVQNPGAARLSLLVFRYPGNPKFAGNVR